MENGGVDITVINSRQHKIGQMADIPPLVAYSFFKFQEHEVPQIESETMQNTLIHTYFSTDPTRIGQIFFRNYSN